jgi:hypothetical protein
MAQPEGPQDRGGGEPRPATSPVVLVLLGILGLGLWAFAAWETYVDVPRARRLLADFKMQSDPLPRAVLEHAGLALPCLAGAGLLLAWWTRSRWAWALVLLGLPLVAGLTLAFIKLRYLNRLLEGLGK